MTRWYLKEQFRFVAGPVHAALYDLENGTVTRVLDPLAGWLAQWLSGGEAYSEQLPALQHVRDAGFLTSNPDEGAADPALKVAKTGRRRMAWLELTPQCNYRCIHCYAESGPQRSGTLPTERWQSLVREVAEAGFEVLQFTGGDPSVHPDMLSLVELAHASGIPLVEVYTNAMRLKPEWIETFARLGTHLAVSFYGPDAETYESITAVPGSFNRVVRNLQEILRAGIPLRIGLVLMPENEGQENATRAFLASLGIAPERISADAVRPTGRGDGHMISSASSSPAHGFVSLDTLTSSARDAPFHAADSFPWAQYRLPGRFRVSGQGAEYASCWSGELAVTPEGDVVPCIFARDTVLGSVADGSLASVIGSPELQEVWDLNLGSSQDCQTCEFRFACFDCRALTVAVTGQLHDKPPGCRYDPGSGTQQIASLSPEQMQQLLAQVPVILPLEELGAGLVRSGNQLAQLDSVGSACLFAFRQGVSVADCIALLQERFPDVSASQLTHDIVQWLLHLQASGLVAMEGHSVPDELADGGRG